MKNRLNQLHLIGLSVILAGCMGSCSKDDPGKTPHPDKGVIEITPQWNACAEASKELPTSYKVQIGEILKEMDAVKACFPGLFPPDTYRLKAWNEAAHISVNGSVATIEKNEDGSLHTAPGFLFAAGADVTVTEDDTVRIQLPMEQHVRRLAFTLALQGETEDIESITGKIHGVACSIDLFEGTLSGETSAEVNFPMKRVSPDATEVTGSLRTFGILPEKKAVLALHIEYTGGYEQDIESDITSLLDGFEEGTETFPIESELKIEKQTEGGFTGTITDWKKNDEYVEIEYTE